MAVSDLVKHLASISPAAYCQLFYVLAATAVLGIAVAPESIRRLLTQYGARSSPTSKSDDKEGRQARDGPLVSIVSWATSVGKVPHSWFIHFYILSVSCSIFWAAQFLSHGNILEFIVKNQAPSEISSMSINQVIIVWALMSLQGARRLYEYVAIVRSSSSKMWIIHWVLGIAYYFCTSISIWIHGSRSIQSSDRRTFNIDIPSFNTVFGVITFWASWFMQYRCHRYLSQLKKYSLPVDGLFQYLVCPHYTCECVLYLSLALIAAPVGQLYNRTLICAVLFVAVNLGVTANGTKKWYSEKFGHERVQGKWKMIPGIF
ncbi:Polyprenol reductase [Daldinia childiae]|uniref:Polyprenol reductase n=1 Tax=Daldinia childiae TaxID=326645 RepID=UPI0014452D23|nr:Polyprenol reductase [Daldinia childiae]KAF3064714.1 Polyprenol reductase [Daldinia childiae]